MTASLNKDSYEPVWSETIFADLTKTYRVSFATFKEAQYFRFRGYGFMRALRKWYSDPEVAKVVKEPWEGVIKSINTKELIIRPSANGYDLVIRPRSMTTPMVVVEETDMSKVLPAVKAVIEDDEFSKELEKEYKERIERGEVKPQPTEREIADAAMKGVLDMFRYTPKQKE